MIGRFSEEHVTRCTYEVTEPLNKYIDLYKEEDVPPSQTLQVVLALIIVWICGSIMGFGVLFLFLMR